ncbi:cbb3-type cytochrome oxidase assembly protein CcoS [Paracoccus contaminans]|uniref:cbb3-type cytochrome oxidase assembly protein CcoS n=1 Tax=Paracoccus contaminans TaxID=1945662 RepID=UPI003B82ED5B
MTAGADLAPICRAGGRAQRHERPDLSDPRIAGPGGIGAGGFLWSLRHRQYEDPKGDAERILSKEWDDRPKQ